MDWQTLTRNILVKNTLLPKADWFWGNPCFLASSSRYRTRDFLSLSSSSSSSISSSSLGSGSFLKKGNVLISPNPFHATCLFLYPLETLENLWFCDVFSGHRKRRLVWIKPIFPSYTNSSTEYRFIILYLMKTLDLNGLELDFSEEELIHRQCKTQEPGLSLFCSFA